MRQALIKLYRLDLLQDSADLGFHIAVARGLLHRVRASQQTSLPPGSPVPLAMDPYIARRLPNFMPIRVTDIPPPDETWDALDRYLQYWGEVGHLVNSHVLLKWEVSANDFTLGQHLQSSSDCRFASICTPPQASSFLS